MGRISEFYICTILLQETDMKEKSLQYVEFYREQNSLFGLYLGACVGNKMCVMFCFLFGDFVGLNFLFLCKCVVSH